MILSNSIALLTFHLLASSVDSFGVFVQPSSTVGFRSTTTTTTTARTTITTLFAEEGGAENAETAAQEEEMTAAGDDVDNKGSTDDILSSPAFLKRKLEVLKSDIAKVEQETEELKKLVEEGKAEWGPQLDDLQSEYKLIQERMTNQNKQGNTQATVAVARAMLDLLDNFDRAFGFVKPETEEQLQIEAEYKETYQMVLETFKGLGVTEVETLGKEFDYEVHQAVMQKPSEDYEEGMVCDELQKGYALGDTLIRPAMVAVAL